MICSRAFPLILPWDPLLPNSCMFRASRAKATTRAKVSSTISKVILGSPEVKRSLGSNAKIKVECSKEMSYDPFPYCIFWDFISGVVLFDIIGKMLIAI